MVSDRSNGIYRSLIAAIVGLILIGAAELPKKAAQPEQGKEQREIANALKDIAASLKDAQKPDQTTEPCDPKKPNRNSDLCAQWKAADAAADAVEAAWRQILIGWIGLVLGAITMIAAIAAACFAKKAADATSNTHKTLIATERGHISFYMAKFQRKTADAPGYSLELYVHNLGNALATIKSIHWHMGAPIFPKETKDKKAKVIHIRSTDGDALYNNSQILQGLHVDPPNENIWPDEPSIMGFVDYETIGKFCRSHFCFQLKFVKADGNVQANWDCIPRTCADMPDDT